jgi:DNA-directed RNA polymerase II subunit RPB2
MAIPSRMTIGQLMEVIIGKVCTVEGCFGDATPFMGVTVDNIVAQLRGCGFEGYANEVMYNGRTGNQIPTAIFIGPTYYQRLKHMVADKVHSRSTGAYSGLIRQPAEGRSRGGGLRLGEMERDVIACSGMMSFLKERFVENSDNFKVHVCGMCKKMAIVNPDINLFRCRHCRNTSKFSEVRIPYSCKLFLQEIASLGVDTRFNCM